VFRFFHACSWLKRLCDTAFTTIIAPIVRAVPSADWL
jgi:hypothetical protein